MTNWLKKGVFYDIPIGQGWPIRGPIRNFCGPIENGESAIFRYFGCIFSGFCYNVAQKVNIFGKFSKMRPKDRFGLATPTIGYTFSMMILLKNPFLPPVSRNGGEY
jgi:hypothetical protein